MQFSLFFKTKDNPTISPQEDEIKCLQKYTVAMYDQKHDYYEINADLKCSRDTE